MSEARAPAASVRVFAAFLVARAVFGLVYLAVAAGSLPILWYRPLDRAWEFAASPRGFAMGWYDTTLAALAASSIAGAIAYLVSARGPLSRALAKGAVVLSIARAGGLVLLVDFAYFGWTLTHQTPTPLPAPSCAAAPP